jgi:hypothetical protein
MTAGGMAQAVDCLPSKCKALTLNPSIQKKKKSLSIKEPFYLSFYVIYRYAYVYINYMYFNITIPKSKLAFFS